MAPEALAALHARCFGAAPRPWRAAEFAEVLAAPGAFLVGDATGFALGRVAADEAELLTLAVDPASRRRGRGADLVAAVAREAALRGAARLILEVAEDNGAARALYLRCGFTEAGRRPGYYGAGRHARDAIVLHKTVRPHHAVAGKTD